MSDRVKVRGSIVRMLEDLRRKFKDFSIDEIIRKLVLRVNGIPESMFGAHPEMKPFTSKDEARIHEL